MRWIITLLILTAFGLGLCMTNILGFTPTKLKLFSHYKWVGITALVLTMLHALWRLTHPAPGPVSGMSKWQHAVAEAVYAGLCLLTPVVPLTGYLPDIAADVGVVYLGLQELPMLFDKNDTLKNIFGMAHEWLNWTTAVIVVMHILATLKHHVVDHDGTLRRVMPFLRQFPNTWVYGTCRCARLLVLTKTVGMVRPD